MSAGLKNLSYGVNETWLRIACQAWPWGWGRFSIECEVREFSVILGCYWQIIQQVIGVQTDSQQQRGVKYVSLVESLWLINWLDGYDILKLLRLKCHPQNLSKQWLQVKHMKTVSNMSGKPRIRDCCLVFTRSAFSVFNVTFEMQ